MLLVAITTALVLAFWVAAKSRAAEARATMGITITILPGCVTNFDRTTLVVSERCNFPRPYRIDSAAPRIGVPAASAVHVACGRVQHQVRRIDRLEYCGVGSPEQVVVIYY